MVGVDAGGGEVLVDVFHEVDVEDVALAGGGGEAEDGLALTYVGTVAAEVGVEVATRHVPGDDLLALAVDGDGLLDGGCYLRPFVGAVEQPQVTVAAACA